jgi:hypothetical protein
MRVAVCMIVAVIVRMAVPVIFAVMIFRHESIPSYSQPYSTVARCSTAKPRKSVPKGAPVLISIVVA